MDYYIIFNLILAVIWCFLQQKFNFSEFVIGGMFGFCILYFFKNMIDERMNQRRSLERRNYFSITFHTIKFFLRFMLELFKANIQVVKIVLSPTVKIRPGIISYQLGVNTDAGITLLANSITLTPGTLSVDVSSDRKKLYIHAIDMDDARELEQSIRDSLEKYSKEVLG